MKKNFNYKDLKENKIKEILKTLEDLKFYQVQNKIKKKLMMSKFGIEKIPKNEIIFRYGEQAKKFYIIIEGEIEVFIPEILKKTLKENYLSKMKNSLFNRKICSLGKGKHFGEIGIIENRTRLASIITKKDSLFCVFSKKDFNEHLKDTFLKTYLDKAKIFNYLLNDYCVNDDIIKISSYFYFKKINKDDFLYKEKDFFKNVFFIIKGEIVLKKSICKKKKEFFKNDNKKKLLDRLFKKHTQLQKINKDIIYLGKHMLFALTEFQNKSDTYNFSACAMKETELFFIDRKHLTNLLIKYDGLNRFFKSKINLEMKRLKFLLKNCIKNNFRKNKVKSLSKTHNIKLKTNFLKKNIFNSIFSIKKNYFSLSLRKNKNYTDYKNIANKIHFIKRRTVKKEKPKIENFKVDPFFINKKLQYKIAKKKIKFSFLKKRRSTKKLDNNLNLKVESNEVLEQNRRAININLNKQLMKTRILRQSLI